MCKTNGQLVSIFFFAKKHCFKRSQSIKLCMSPSNTWTGTAVSGAAAICESTTVHFRFSTSCSSLSGERNAAQNISAFKKKKKKRAVFAPGKITVTLCHSKYHLKRHLANQIRTKFCITMYI